MVNIIAKNPGHQKTIIEKSFYYDALLKILSYVISFKILLTLKFHF